jgi:hypothetical protein
VKIGLITTIDTNIGDDFIREGIYHVLKEVFKGERLEFVCINKHNPYTVYPAWHPVHLRNVADHLPVGKHHVINVIESLLPKIGSSCFDDCDLIVQCGAPVFWPNCSRNEWAKPIWQDVIGRLCGKIPVLNLAAGSCYPWERQPAVIEQTGDAEYIKTILGYCRLTTVRDRFAKSICKSLDWEIPLIPCSAFLAARGRIAKIQESGYILLNYMTGSGHYAWDQEIDAKKWEETIKAIISRLGKRHKLAFLCHNEMEFAIAQELAPDLPRFFPKTVYDYFKCIAEAKFGINNRMHASVGMAGMGVPSVAVCTDTRLLMVAELGLPVHYVKDIDADILEEEAEIALNSLKTEKERLLVLQSKTWEMYLSAVRKALSRS